MSALTDLTNFDIDWLDDDLVAALTFKFDPRQPRDEEGKWTDTGVSVLKKVLPAIIYKKHPDGAVVAQRGNRRLRWDEGARKFTAEEHEDGGWVEKVQLTKTAAYTEMKEGDWSEPSDSTTLPAPAASSETPKPDVPVVAPTAETPSSSPGTPDSTLLSVSDVPAQVEDAPAPSTQSRGEFDERYEGPRFEFPEGVDFDAMDRYRTEVARQYVFSDLVFERTTKLLADKERYPGFGAYSRAQADAAAELEAEGFVPADHNAIDSALTDLLASLPPTDYKLRDQVQRRAQAEAQMEGRLQAFAELHGLGPVTPKLKREFAKKIRADFAGKKIAVRVTPKNLEHILSDGRFKSQFETNKSKGLNNNQGRASAENIWFGIDDNIFVNQERRPIYGYVMVDGVRPAGYTEGTLGGTSVDALSQYGQIQVVLKDQVRERTTAVYGDSLNHASFGMPSPVNQPSWTSFTPMIGKAGIAANFSDVDRNSEDFRLRSESYVEAQIHDGVSTDDVAEVIFPSKPNAVLQKLLDERGVPWRVLTLKSAIKAGGDEGNTARHYAEQQRTYAEGKIAELKRKIDERRIAGQQPYSEQLTELKRLQKIHNDATAALSLKSATRRSVPFEQRERIYTAATLVDTYDQLPYDVRELLAQMRAELPAPYETGD